MIIIHVLVYGLSGLVVERALTSLRFIGGTLCVLEQG